MPRKRKPVSTETPAQPAPEPAPTPTEIKIKAARGRPMLQWVGKTPLTKVTAFPAQRVEAFIPDPFLANEMSTGIGERGGVSPLIVPGERGGVSPLILWNDWPKAYCRGGLLFHGDNKDVLAHLIANGFRGKVKLVYIDPPFDSGADYVRTINLRGKNGASGFGGETYSINEQLQYTDIWANDNYLQFIFERLLLLRELMADDSSFFLHCDHHRNYLLRALLDEVFGPDSFQNEIVREKQRGGKHHVQKSLGSIHDTILHYSKGEQPTWHHGRRVVSERIRMERYPYEDEKGRYALADCRNFSGVSRPNLTYTFLGFEGTWKWTKEEMTRKFEEGEVVQAAAGNVPRRKVRSSDDGDLLQSLWYDVADSNGSKDYPTEKSEDLLERLIRMTSNRGDLVLDCFIGSGTTAAVAQRLGRRWIGCDINKGAIQTTSKRLQTIITEQIDGVKKAKAEKAQSKMVEEQPETEPAPAQLQFTVWRVNDYDLQIQHNEAVNLACEHIGVERMRSDGYFDGILAKSLVKIVPFGHPLNPTDLEGLKRELDARPDEDRNITLVCLGMELAAKSWIENWNRLRTGNNAINKITVIELRTDPKYGKFIDHKPAVARIKVARKQDALNGGDKARIEIQDFLSPTIIERLQQQAGILQPKIDDWRAMVDCVMIDPAYDGKVFSVALSDVPRRKSDLVVGEYTIAIPDGQTTVAIKIIDMLGEEVLVTKLV